MEKKTPKNQGKNWSTQEIEKLKKLANGNTPTGLIAHELGRSKASISSKASQQNISLQPTNKSPYDRNVSNSKKGNSNKK
ncbi:hypothetical protein U9K52_18585 [Chryseobacterium sp. MHB01]|uniref:hypothetical protein n=1 Tax=Chryseobacterium sp. MHB01 TaxID=3109433 RepID=UPI002AFEF15A|nr:hypothetical protein [Chryseobacterium sp. MHB01]MEA1850926.1 hypothetical protein [Chryseobacterium sp. MHB01]